MTDRAAEVMVYALLLVLPIAALVGRRLPMGRMALMAAAWIVIFLLGLLIVAQIR